MKNLNVVLAPCSALSESVYLEKGKQMNEECCSVKLWTGINYPSSGKTDQWSIEYDKDAYNQEKFLFC